MSERFRNKYRSESARLKNWDYGSNGAYFITICTKNREHFFGEIDPETQTMQLNPIGKLAQQFWLDIPVHFPFVELGEFVVMPNHTHGVLVIDKKNNPEPIAGSALDSLQPVISLSPLFPVGTLQCNVPTGNNGIQNSKRSAINTNKNEIMSNISPKPGTISTIIRSYKSVVSKNAHFINPHFAWQPRFHDHIIRNEISFDRIQKYIANNPMNWKGDRFGK